MRRKGDPDLILLLGLLLLIGAGGRRRGSGAPGRPRLFVRWQLPEQFATMTALEDSFKRWYAGLPTRATTQGSIPDLTNGEVMAIADGLRQLARQAEMPAWPWRDAQYFAAGYEPGFADSSRGGIEPIGTWDVRAARMDAPADEKTIRRLNEAVIGTFAAAVRFYEQGARPRLFARLTVDSSPAGYLWSALSAARHEFDEYVDESGILDRPPLVPWRVTADRGALTSDGSSIAFPDPQAKWNGKRW